MSRKFVDITAYSSGKMDNCGNSDAAFWWDKTIAERLDAAIEMIKVAYQEPGYTLAKVDRTIYSSRKHNSL